MQRGRLIDRPRSHVHARVVDRGVELEDQTHLAGLQTALPVLVVHHVTQRIQLDHVEVGDLRQDDWPPMRLLEDEGVVAETDGDTARRNGKDHVIQREQNALVRLDVNARETQRICSSEA